MNKLINILIRIVVFRERLEKASPEEIRIRLGFIFFGTFAGFYRLNVKYSVIVSVSLLFWVIAEIICRTMNYCAF